MSFLQELKRRNVTKVAVLYVVAAWLILQAAELLFDAMSVSDELLRFVIAILVLGFPLVLIFSWVFELTPEGVKREKDIDRDASITPQTGQRINTVIIVLLVVAVATVTIDRLVPEQAAEPVAAVAVVEEAVAAENTIAVLPFADLSAAGDQEYFSDGIAEEILNVLVRTDGLEVASRTTSFGFKGQESLGIPFIAEKMKVRHVLEGSVRKAGNTVRITAQLIDAQSDKHLWSETYDRQLTAESIFEIQDEIAGAIVEELGALMNTSGATPEIVADTQSLEAYELYLEAHQLFIDRTEIDKSIELFEAAVQADTNFARAWAGLAAAYVVAPSWGDVDRDYSALGVAAANEAIRLNPKLPLSYAALAVEVTERDRPDFEAAISQYNKALELDPKEVTVLLWRGATYLDLGYFEAAVQDLERCLKIDPAYGNCRSYLAITKLFAGNVEEAERLYERALLSGLINNLDPFDYLNAARGQRLEVILPLSYSHGARGEEAWVEPSVNALLDRSFEFESVRVDVEASHRLAFGTDLEWGEDQLTAFLYKNYAAIKGYTFYPFFWYPHPEDFKQSPHRKRLINELGIHDYWRKHGFPPQCRAMGTDDFECD